MSHPVPDQFLCVSAINSTNWMNRATLWCPKLTHSWVTKEILYRAKKEILLNYFASSLSIFVLFLFLIYMSPKLRYILYCLISNSIASAYNWPQTSPIMCELEFRLVHGFMLSLQRERGGWSVLNPDILSLKIGTLLGPSHEREILCGSLCSWHVWYAFHRTEGGNSRNA